MTTVKITLKTQVVTHQDEICIEMAVLAEIGRCQDRKVR